MPLSTFSCVGSTRLPKARSPPPSLRPSVSPVKPAKRSRVAWSTCSVPAPPAMPRLAPAESVDSVALPLPTTGPPMAQAVGAQAEVERVGDDAAVEAEAGAREAVLLLPIVTAPV